MKPDKMEFKVGETIHKAPLKLIYEKDYMGKCSWSIKKEMANQRDDTSIVSGLPVEVLIRIGEIAKEQAKNL